MYGIAQALQNAPMSQQDRDSLRDQMMRAAGNKYRTTSERTGDIFQAMGSALANKVQDKGLRRSLLDAMSAYSSASLRGLTRSQRAQMIGAIDMTMPQPISPGHITQPFNQTLFGSPSGYDRRHYGRGLRRPSPWEITGLGQLGFDEEDGHEY